MRRRASLLLLPLLLAACFRNESRQHFLLVPDASPEQLADLRAHLLAEHLRLPDDLRFYSSIETSSNPPGLLVRFNGRHIARRNIVHAIRDLGFPVNDLPAP